MFQRIGAAAYKADLNNTYAICRVLGDPHLGFRSIHVAGTNGKGTVSHLLASILQESGLNVGLYTSPHLADFRERIRINGQMIPKKDVVTFVLKYQADFEQIKPSFFEMTVGMAFSYFKDQKVDMAVIETGMGGRLDSTNVIWPLISVITNIGHDHQEFLGNTLQAIALEKAGIVKQHTPVVIGETQDETMEVFLRKAAELLAPVTVADQHYFVQHAGTHSDRSLLDGFDIWKDRRLFMKGLESPLKGFYQVKNIVTTLQVVDVLKNAGIFVSDDAIRQGIRRVVANTGLMGRWQVISDKPLTICDVGHNAEGIRQVVNQLQSLTFRRLHIIFGLVGGKDTAAILKLLPATATYYFCRARIPRAIDQHVLAAAANAQGLQGKAYSSVRRALAAAHLAADGEDVIFVGGSTFVVAEVLNPRSPGA